MNMLCRYITLLTTDRKAFRYQLWMVYNRYKINSIKWVYRKVSHGRGAFITTHARPMRSIDIGTWSDKLQTNPKVAIVLQGNLVQDENFTLETIRMYKKHFANTILIVSTHTDADVTLIQQLRDEGAITTQCERPSGRGLGNVNLQVVTAIAGIKLAKELGAEYVYKTRTDQRMYAVNIHEFFLNLLHTFPVVAGYTQKYRIIASGFLSLKYVPYLITDMFQFGHIDDMLAFWDAPVDTRTAVVKPVLTVADAIEARIAESYLVTEYLKRLGRNTSGTIADSWQVYADHFCIVDRETLDLFWYKYDFYHEYQKKDYAGVSNSQLLNFAEWFNLYSGLSNKKIIPTAGLDRTLQDHIPEPVA